MDKRLTKIIDWIRATTDVSGGRGALVPVSGGSDGALCLWLCARALPPERVTAAYVGETLRCRDWFESQGTVRYLKASIPEEQAEAYRWSLMLAEARAVRGWLVGTRNRTEQTLGTYSLASRLATYFPLVGLWKSEVMELCASVGVPAEILESSRRADPSCGRPQELADIPFTQVDHFLQIRTGLRPESELQEFPPGVSKYLDSIYRRNRFKNTLPLCCVEET